MASHAAPPKKTAWFAVGGPVFNFAMVVLLMGISSFIVMSPASGSPGVFGGDEDSSAAGDQPENLAFADLVAGIEGAEPTPTPSSVPGDESSTEGEPSGEGAGSGDGRGGGATSPVAPPWVGSTIRYEPNPVTPTPVPATPTPASTATPQPTATPRPTPTTRPTPTPTPVPLPRCEDFADQASAQAAFDADPAGLTHMDGDRDGLACEHLPKPPPPPVPSTAAVRAEAGLYGIHTRDAPWWMGEVDHIARLTGRTPGSVLFFTNFAQAYPAAQVDTIWRRGMIPVVAWEPIIPGGSHPRLSQITDGTFDAYIDAWAAAVRADGRPIVLRFAAEMNGNWYPWSESANGNEVGDFAPAWRHIHDRFAAAGADNVIWLWSVNRSNTLSTDIAGYYPGDDYVDWIGMSGYLRQLAPGAVPSFSATFDHTLGQLRAVTSKPILLAEVGAGLDEVNKSTWIRSFFEGLQANPDIIGFVYFNDQKSGGDWRLQVAQSVVDAFADGVGHPRWRTGVDPGGMVPGERITLPAGAGS